MAHAKERVHWHNHLGQVQPERLHARLVNQTKVKCEYRCKVA